MCFSRIVEVLSSDLFHSQFFPVLFQGQYHLDFWLPEFIGMIDMLGGCKFPVIRIPASHLPIDETNNFVVFDYDVRAIKVAMSHYCLVLASIL